MCGWQPRAGARSTYASMVCVVLSNACWKNDPADSKISESGLMRMARPHLDIDMLNLKHRAAIHYEAVALNWISGGYKAT